MKQINKDYYCENCFKEHLKEWIEEKDGTIVCSQDCAIELDKIRVELNTPKTRRKNGKSNM